ncbi:lysine N(6)-hydroxylase/L-ornithine N(5)-oxygenase family protein [Jeongeupia wiesaeckerbachi]|uniref:lysine N(6)-hydroxylase/L-ornithine N(5)-oxygenase family protein n=1 Tax=Jeongeupia wiesaeckerbachi TaxID=3051218 RepID=UPI003D801E1B
MSIPAVEHDFIGVGFGPSNLAIAVVMEEQARFHKAGVDYCFIEKKPEFVWHGSMLLEGSDMQISFLKDLVTLRNPTSRFTFINYLHEKDRLKEFINLKTFFPARVEYNDYLRWVAAQFDDRCRYGEEVIGVEPVKEGETVTKLKVLSRRADGSEEIRLTRKLVLGVGGVPSVPEAFEGVRDARVIHSSCYLEQLGKLMASDKPPRRIAVVGGGQSAAEVFMDLVGRGVEVALITRGETLKPSDDSPFVNEIFNPQFTDLIYQKPKACRAGMLERYRNTNYSVVDLDLIESIYQLMYMQRVKGVETHQLLCSREVSAVALRDAGVELALRDRVNGKVEHHDFDAVVLATGYRRDDHKRLLESLSPWIAGYEVDRDYRLRTQPNFLPGIYLQGCCEDSHGLSDTLLSVLSIRSEEIAESLLADRLNAPEAAASVAKQVTA